MKPIQNTKTSSKRISLTKFSTISLSLIFILLIVGCKGGSSGVFGGTNLFKSDSQISRNLITDFHKGTDAIELKLQLDNPPQEIFEQDDIHFVIEMKNKGTSNIENGYLYLINYDPEFEILGETRKAFNIDGKSQFLPEGGFQILEFDASNIRSPTLKRSTFTITACYPYSTEASLDICLNPNIQQHLKVVKAGCKADKVVTSSGHGAPIVVRRVEQRIKPLKGGNVELDLVFEIDNLGDGEVSEFEKFCSGHQRININEISFSGKSLSNGEIQCNKIENDEQGNYIILEKASEKNRFRCTTELAKSEGSYNTVLQLDLSYGYSNSIEKTIYIEPLE